jgi:dissimilatory sulfite reductase (desulfoviridin) alpha/beta subunit
VQHRFYSLLFYRLQHNSIRQHGHIKQQQQGFVAVRIRTIAGNMTSDQLRKVAYLSDKYGQGQLHITTRQSVEIHWVQENQKGERIGTVINRIGVANFQQEISR